MPSCPTKLFAVFLCLRASPRSNLYRTVTASTQSRMQQRRGRSALGKLRSWAAKWLSEPGNGRRKPQNNASRPGVPLQMSGAVTPVHQPNPQVRRRRHAAEQSLCATCAVLVLTLVFSAAALADAAPLFQTGRAEFEAQNYEAALEAFEAASAAGLPGPAVHFNIGVTAYRLGLYARAETAFLEVARTPAMAALAHYNLGLVALRRKNTDDAARWFTLVVRQTEDERLHSLASTQLALLPAPPQRNWVGYAAFNAGYDDNVALVSNSDVLGVSGVDDSFAEAQLALTAPLGQPWRFDAGLVLLDYQELDRFDQVLAHGGGRYRLNAGDWLNEIGVQFAYATLDGKGFENWQILLLQTSTELRPHWRLRGRYQFGNINGMNDFTGVGGHRHEASAYLGWDHGPWNLGVEYQLDKNDLDDESLSATRQQLAVDVGRTVGDAWVLALQFARRHSRYDVQSNGVENRAEVAFAITRSLSARWRLVARYAYADNAADLPEFDYQRSRISAGVEAIM